MFNGLKAASTSALAPVLVLTTSCTLWGLSWIPLRAFSGIGIDGLGLICVSHTILALIFLPFFQRQDVHSGNIRYLIGISIAGGVGIFSFTYAFMYGDVVRVMVLFYLLPVWGVLGGRIFLGEAFGIRRALGLVLALPGAFLVLGGTAILDSPPSWMDALALLAGLSFAANNILFRGVGHVHLSTKLLAMFIGCAVITGGLMIAGLQAFPSVQSSSWLWLLLYTLTWLLLANIGSQWAVERMEAGRSSIIIIVQLFVAVISAVTLGEETLTLSELIGCLLVVSAAVLEASRSKT